MALPAAQPDRKPVVVAADDDADLLNVIRIKLEGNGVRVVLARDGQEAIAAVRKHHPVVVILDVIMPKLNGFQVARMIKFDKQLKSIPVIMLTVRNQPSDRNLGTQVGADEYLNKPFDPQQLLDRVHYWLKRRKDSMGGDAASTA